MHASHRQVVDQLRSTRTVVNARARRRRPQASFAALLEPELAATPVAAPTVHRINHDGGILLPAAPPPEPESMEVERAQFLGSELGVSTTRMQSILERWPPQHSQLDLEHVSMTLQGLAAALHIRPGDAAALVSQEHRLLSTPPSQVHAAVHALSAALRLPPPAVLLAARSRPSLLFEQPDACSARLEANAAALQVSVQQLLAAGYQVPFLLSAQSDTLSARAAALHSQLGVHPGPSVLMKYSRLICMAPSDIQSKVQCLSQCLQLKPQNTTTLVLRYPKLLQYTSQRMQQHVASLTEVMPLPMLQQVVFEEPSLLERSPAHALKNVAKLQQLLSCTREQALHLVSRRPALLTRSVQSLTGSFRALSIWRFSQAEKRELVMAQPLLLRLSSREVNGRCRWLRELVLSNGYYHSAMRRLPMSLVGLIIMHLPDAWGRLQYLAESGQEAGSDIMGVVQASEQYFSQLHPGYRKWLEWKCSFQACVTPWQANSQYQNQQPMPSTGPQGSNHRPVTARSSNSGQLQPTSRRRHHAAPPRPPQQFSRGGPQHTPLQHRVALPLQFSPQPAPGTSSGDDAPQHTVLEEVVEVHEAQTLRVGKHYVRKPRRVVNTVARVQAEEGLHGTGQDTLDTAQGHVVPMAGISSTAVQSETLALAS